MPGFGILERRICFIIVRYVTEGKVRLAAYFAPARRVLLNDNANYRTNMCVGRADGCLMT